MPILVITEKPSVARSISQVLGATKKDDGFIEGGGYIVSWCAGHLIGLANADAYDEKYAKWRYADLPIVPGSWKYITLADKQKQLKILSGLLKRTDIETVVNACDAGREGELIFRHVYEYAKCKKPMKRLWISSMEDTAIRDGMNKLCPGQCCQLKDSQSLFRFTASPFM